MRLVARYDWRAFSDEEAECNFLVWKDIGRRMSIEDIPETLKELEEWSKEYETTYMVPSESSHRLATMALDYIGKRVPNVLGARFLVRSLFVCMMDDQLRMAAGLPAQPKYAHLCLRTILALRAFIIRHCKLPRFKPHEYIVIKDPPHSTGSDGLMRLHTIVRRHHPWYYPAPKGWHFLCDWFLGFTSGATYPGPAFKSEGYRLEELGPTRFELHGHEEVMTEAEELYGAPIEKPWSR